MSEQTTEATGRWSCQRARGRLPRLVDGTLVGWQRRLVERHLAGCTACAAERERQEAVAAGLEGLRAAAPAPQPDPPAELLDAILTRVGEPDIRARLAVPARGAVSGARPELSAAGLLLTALVVYLVWRIARALADRLDRAP